MQMPLRRERVRRGRASCEWCKRVKSQSVRDMYCVVKRCMALTSPPWKSIASKYPPHCFISLRRSLLMLSISYMVWEEQRNCEPRLTVTTFGAESLCVENEYVVFPPSVLFHVCGGSFSAVCHRDNAICTHSPPSHSLRRSINTNTRTHCLPP